MNEFNYFNKKKNISKVTFKKNDEQIISFFFMYIDFIKLIKIKKLNLLNIYKRTELKIKLNDNKPLYSYKLFV
jgi:hypothetical protein